MFGVCRGFRKSTSPSAVRCIPEIRELPGHANHRGCRGWRTAKFIPMPPSYFADRHDVRPGSGRRLHAAAARLPKPSRVNSLHGQGILQPGKRVVIEERGGRRHHRSDPGLRMRQASHSAFSGTPSTTRSTTRLTARCSRRSARPCWSASGWLSFAWSYGLTSPRCRPRRPMRGSGSPRWCASAKRAAGPAAPRRGLPRSRRRDPLISALHRMSA